MSLEADALADRRRLRRKLSFWRVAAFVVALIAVLAAIGMTARDGNILPVNHIARVNIHGIITDNREQQKLLRDIADNKRAKALILDIDSPGGTTTGAEALFEAIRAVADKKPVVASLGTVAASGGYIAAIGADHIVYPERSAGERVAHTVAGHMIDYFEFEDGFAMARTLAPSFAWGRSLAESAIRTRHDVTVVGLKRPGEDFIYAVPETVVLEGDQLIVSGSKRDVERFARIS